MDPIITKMTPETLNQAYEIIQEAKEIFKAQGINQWQNGYPNQETLENDLQTGQAYVIQDTKILGYFALVFDNDPFYKDIKGKWLTNDAYATIHRFVISSTSRGKGYAKKSLKGIEKLVREKDIKSIRVDTHHDNKAMLKLLETSGYIFCGSVEVNDGARLAYEKII